MKVTQLAVGGVALLEPDVFKDERGFFFESFNKRKLEEALGQEVGFVQENHSRSSKNVLRGLHYQIQQAQGKLVRVVSGTVFDVALDLRKSSPSFGHHVTQELSAENRRMLWIPQGFAHGFLVLSESAEVVYMTTDYWAPQFERTVAWDDSAIGISWPSAGDPVLSAKDRHATAFSQAEYLP